MVTSGKQLCVQVHTTCSGLEMAEVVLLLQDPGLGQVRVTSASAASCSAVRWHLVTKGCINPKVMEIWKAHVWKGDSFYQAEMEVEVTLCEVPNEERRCTVPLLCTI